MKDSSSMSEHAALQELLQAGVASLGLSFDDAQMKQMLGYLLAVLDENQHVNVTAIREPEAAVAQHLIDSLALVKVWNEHCSSKAPSTAFDLGTGGGFPAAVLAAAWPHCKVTAVDSTGKKVAVVERCSSLVGITNLTTLHARGAELPALQPQFRQAFKLSTARAVGPAVKLLKELLPLTSRHGWILLMKGPEVTGSEFRAAQRLAEKRDFIALDPISYSVPDVGDRTILPYRGNRVPVSE